MSAAEVMHANHTKQTLCIITTDLRMQFRHNGRARSQINDTQDKRTT